MANVFERSLFKIGDGGIALVIPKSFAIAHHLEPGDVLRVKTNSKLVVEPVVIAKWRRNSQKRRNVGKGTFPDTRGINKCRKRLKRP